VAVIDVGGARLWYDEAGEGQTVLLLHGGLGDSGLWEPVVPFLAERFRTIRTDLRFFGRSTGPAVPWSWEEDVVGVLDGLGVERAALVGLSLGGRIALDVALAHPDRLWAVAGVAPGLAGHEGAPYTEEQGGRRTLRVVEQPDDILLVVAGGAGSHSASIPGWYSRSVTLRIARADGSPLRSVRELERGR